MPTLDYARDVVSRTPGTNLRIATFNVENLFCRPIAMDYEDSTTGQPYLDAYSELNSLFIKQDYSDEDKARILTLMTKYNLVGSRRQNDHLEFRKIRGELLAKEENSYQVRARGRRDWVGWVELKKRKLMIRRS